MSTPINPVQEWYYSDFRLKSIIDRINATNKSFEEQAREAFFELCEEYQLPKFPDSFTDEDYERLDKVGIDNPRSVFEEIGIIRYLEDNEDPRGFLLLAIYNIKNGTYIDIDECAIKHFGSEENIPKEYMVFYLGEDIDSKLYFVGNESWVDLGAKCATKIIR